jgi:hypothetical protein
MIPYTNKTPGIKERVILKQSGMKYGSVVYLTGGTTQDIIKYIDGKPYKHGCTQRGLQFAIKRLREIAANEGVVLL